MECIHATLCYIFRDHKILLIYGVQPHAPHYQKWNDVGRKFEPEDEGDPDRCCKREVHEETGLTATTLVRLGAILFTGMFPNKEILVHIHICTEFTGELKKDGSAGELRWISIEDLPYVPMLEGDWHFLPWVLTERKFVARFVLKDRAYVNRTVVFTDRPQAG